MEHLFTEGAESTDINLELLLGVQGWRKNLFSLYTVKNLPKNVLEELEEEDVDVLQAIFGYNWKTNPGI